MNLGRNFLTHCSVACALAASPFSSTSWLSSMAL
uniref:Twin-arginine translocation signal domain-containing protein n=1 Tax=Schlesneria paludicola TaxID=360056 RepID=A0A7C2NYX7_9PLAN